MVDPILEGSCTRAELGKRLSLPGILARMPCPKCGVENRRNLGDGVLSAYPRIGQPVTLYWYCPSCEHEWQTYVMLRLTVENTPAPAPETPHE